MEPDALNALNVFSRETALGTVDQDLGSGLGHKPLGEPNRDPSAPAVFDYREVFQTEVSHTDSTRVAAIEGEGEYDEPSKTHRPGLFAKRLLAEVLGGITGISLACRPLRDPPDLAALGSHEMIDPSVSAVRQDSFDDDDLIEEVYRRMEEYEGGNWQRPAAGPDGRPGSVPRIAPISLPDAQANVRIFRVDDQIKIVVSNLQDNETITERVCPNLGDCDIPLENGLTISIRRMEIVGGSIWMRGLSVIPTEE